MDTNTPNKQSVTIKFDLRWVVLFLLAVIVAMTVLWRPWQHASATDRTVQVTGETTLSAEPDEYVFYPTYEIKNADKQAALTEITKKSDEVVAKIKALGVSDNKIKTDTNGSRDYYTTTDDNQTQYNLTLTVTVNDKTLAQKVQDYLVTTAPTGSVSPQAQFSKTKQKALESQARDAAAKDARAKAEQSAKNLGFKVGAVKSISDGNGFGVMPMMGANLSVAADAATTTKSSLAVQPGENDLTYSVTVTYYIR